MKKVDFDLKQYEADFEAPRFGIRELQGKSRFSLTVTVIRVIGEFKT